MAITTISQQNRANLCRLLLLLVLAGLQSVVSAHGETSKLDNDEDGPKVNCTIVGLDYVTVGVPSSMGCYSSCAACTYSMAIDGQGGQGNEVVVILRSWMEALTVTCNVTNNSTHMIATATKQLQVLAGPSNVSISGPDLMHPTMKHTYSCHAYCRPSCTYAWRIDKELWVSGLTNVVSITPKEEDKFKILSCKATNPVSGLYATASQNVGVIMGPSEIRIDGPDVIDIGQKYRIECTSVCLPSCRYSTTVDRHTVRGNVVEITVEHPRKSVTVKCQAENTASRKTASAFKTIPVKARNSSTRPGEISAVLLMAFIISAAFTL